MEGLIMEILLVVIILLIITLAIAESVQESTGFSVLMLILCVIAVAGILVLDQEKSFTKFRDNTQVHADYSTNTAYKHWLIDNPK